MTKEEIRVLTLSKLKITPQSHIVDVGAGTGSLSIECGLLAPGGKVYAVEKEEEGVGLIRQNAEKFQVKNIQILHGTAPKALENIPQADRIIVGGSGGNLEGILRYCKELLNPRGRIVVNAILIETVYETLQQFEDCGFINIEFIQVSISRMRKLGKKNGLLPLNPITILWADQEENK